jgi:undecaprenyl diphosphate synthase
MPLVLPLNVVADPSAGGDGNARRPDHLAIIMDGNGRWATQRGLPRAEGHRRGVEALRRTVRAVGELGIPVLTIFSFSSENWRRPAEEVGELMSLLKIFVRRDLAELHRENVRVTVIGERMGLAHDIHDLLGEAERLTAGNTGLRLIIAFNYGARQEILRAVRKLATDAVSGTIAPADITADMLTGALDTAGLPDPDLIIRTSGETRLSNFLLWQAAYSELVFMPVLWPDFDREHLREALADFAGRERRFGGVSATGR